MGIEGESGGMEALKPQSLPCATVLLPATTHVILTCPKVQVFFCVCSLSFTYQLIFFFFFYIARSG